MASDRHNEVLDNTKKKLTNLTKIQQTFNSTNTEKLESKSLTV